ncbi:MAG: galactokinase [Balneolaceae bacterium]|nr:galactokinase [Balneolaceae bacterium]
MVKKIYNDFKSRFDTEPILIQSPGRVNLIGEHTDYNEGFVLPAAIDKVIVLGCAANESKKARLHSIDMKESFEVDLSKDLEKSDYHWANYILGVVDQLKIRGDKIEGFDCVFGGDIPIGAGLSSSAALEGGVVLGLSKLFDLSISKTEMAKIGQAAENHFVGMQCGIMDQFANLHGKEGHALKLDCRSLEFELYPFHRSDIKIILCDTNVHRELTSSEYNIRRQQCEEGVQILKQFDYDIKSLRDVSMQMLKKHMGDFTPVVFERCIFILEENKRVEAACEALTNDDLETFGKLMYESHYGLRDLYEVSCKELDVLVEITEKLEGVFGSRMMGGGFGGCTINLVKEEFVDEFIRSVERKYSEKIGDDLEIYQASINDGTKQIFRES